MHYLADFHTIVQQVRYMAGRRVLAARLTLHRNAQPFTVRCIGQAVLARLIDTEFVHEPLHAQILAGFESAQAGEPSAGVR